MLILKTSTGFEVDGNPATVDRHAVGAVRDLHRQELPKRNDDDDNDVEGFG
jgi:hypothetical protein